MRKIFFLLLLVWLSLPIHVCAEDLQKEAEGKIFSQFEFDEINHFLNKTFPDEKLEFHTMIKQLISGEQEITLEWIGNLIKEQFFYEFTSTKSSLIHVLLIVVLAAVLHNFSGVFSNNQVSEMGFYILYMLLITICLNSFRVLVSSALSGLSNMLGFLSLLGPIYFLAVAIATGSATSVAFYNMILILICVVEIIIQNFLIPFVQVYMLVKVLNEVSKEEFLTKLAELLHTVIRWSLKILLAGVVGFNFIQGLLTPAIDSVKRSIVTGSGEAIPVIGDAIGGAAEVILGTAVLIKNGIGVAGAVICIAICMAPVIQMGVIVLIYRLIAAMIQPISEKRMVSCISSMADGTEMLLRVVFTSGTLFLVTIAMVASTTS